MKPGLAAFAALGLALGGSAPAASGPAAPLLKSRPSAASATLPVGETLLVNGAMAYRPASATRAAPLLILLHGAGGYPPNFLQAMKPVSERLGVMLLAPRSAARTWDLVRNMQKGDDPWRGPDASRLDQTLGDLFPRAAVDPSRVALLGFSDGASYALSLGVSNPKLFTAVIALSPGMFVPPARVDRAQRVFIAHGRSDAVLPFAAAKDMAGTLRDAGGNVRFRSFDGGHQIDRDSLAEALDWALSSREP